MVAIVIMVFAGSVAAGALLRRRLRTQTAAAGAATALLVFRVTLARFPEFEAAVMGWDWYPFVEPYWTVPCVGFVVGVAAVAVKRVWIRVPALVAGGLSFTWVAAGTVLGGEQPLTGEVRDGVCEQTSGYSCGAAAAAMWLDSQGVRASEAEMAELCVTDGWFGTSPLGMLRGIRRKAGGGVGVVAAKLPVAAEGPWLAVVQYSSMVDHWVVIDRIDAGGADVRDPIGGRTRWTRGELERRWRGVVVKSL